MNTVVRARIDQATKDEATVILDTIGLTVSDAFRLMMRRIVAEKRLPFDPLVPNATTLAAIEAVSEWNARPREKWRLATVKRYIKALAVRWGRSENAVREHSAPR